MFERGILVLNSHNATLSHNARIQNRIFEIHDDMMSEVATSLVEGRILKKMKVSPPKPLFNVRLITFSYVKLDVENQVLVSSKCQCFLGVK